MSDSSDLSVLSIALKERRDEYLYRYRRCAQSPQAVEMVIDNKQIISFCSNDYLGLANDDRVKQANIEAVRAFGIGSGASHLINGHSQYHHDLENAIAIMTNRPRALLFSTGYMANIGVINALIGPRDLVIQDRLNHASLLDGGWLSRGESSRYEHSDLIHARQLLSNNDFHSQRKLVVTDGVFSMDGDLALLPALAELCNNSNSWLMVDDAHGFGVLGDQAGGLIQHYGLSIDEVPILVGTLSKAVGCFGAFVAGGEELIETLIQFARTYIYTTALPPAIAASALKSLQIISEEPERRLYLSRLIEYFKKEAGRINLPLLPSSTPIQPLMIGCSEKALEISQLLENKGLLVTAIRPPTVPKDTARLRITLSAGHTNSHIDQLLEALNDINRCYGLLNIKSFT